LGGGFTTPSTRAYFEQDEDAEPVAGCEAVEYAALGRHHDLLGPGILGEVGIGGSSKKCNPKPPNKGLPWTIGGTLFWVLGVDFYSAISQEKSAFFLSLSNKKGGWTSIWTVFWRARGGPLFGHGTNKEGGTL